MDGFKHMALSLLVQVEGLIGNFSFDSVETLLDQLKYYYNTVEMANPIAVTDNFPFACLPLNMILASKELSQMISCTSSSRRSSSAASQLQDLTITCLRAVVTKSDSSVALLHSQILFEMILNLTLAVSCASGFQRNVTPAEHSHVAAIDCISVILSKGVKDCSDKDDSYLDWLLSNDFFPQARPAWARGLGQALAGSPLLPALVEALLRAAARGAGVPSGGGGGGGDKATEGAEGGEAAAGAGAGAAGGGPKALSVAALQGLLALGALTLRAPGSQALWARLFPGVAGGLAKVARGRGAVAASIALQALAGFTALVCGDPPGSPPPPGAEDGGGGGGGGGGDSLGAQAVRLLRRRQAQAGAAAAAAGGDEAARRLRALLPAAAAAGRAHGRRGGGAAGWRARRATAALGAAAALRCSARFAAFLPELAEGLVFLALDPMPQVADVASGALQRALAQSGPFDGGGGGGGGGGTGPGLRRGLAQRAQGALARLPSAARGGGGGGGGGGAEPLGPQLDLAAAYLQVLGDIIKVQLESSISKLASILQQVFEFDDVIIQQVLEPSPVDGAQEGGEEGAGVLPEECRYLGYAFYRKPLKHIRTSDELHSAKRFLGVLGTAIDLSTFVELLSIKLETEFPSLYSSRERLWLWVNSILPLLYCLIGMLEGVKSDPVKKQQLVHLANELVPFFLRCKAWSLPTTIEDIDGNPLLQMETPENASMVHFSRKGQDTTTASGRPPGGGGGGGGGGTPGGLSAQVLQGFSQAAALLLEALAAFAGEAAAAAPPTPPGRGRGRGAAAGAAGAGAAAAAGWARAALYPVLERAADPAPAVRRAALQALLRFARAARCGSLRTYLHANLDYLTDALCARLRRASAAAAAVPSGMSSASFPPRLARAVEALFRHSGAAAAAPLVEDVVDEVLRQLDTRWRDAALARALARVLHVLVEQTAVPPPKFPQPQDNMCDESDAIKQDPSHWLQQLGTLIQVHDTETLDSQSVIDDDDVLPGMDMSPNEVERYFKERAERAKEENDLEMQKDKDREAEEEEEISNPPREIKVVIEVLDRCGFLIATPDLKMQNLVLQTLASGLERLQQRPRLLLPRVHRLWPPIVARLEQFTELGARRRHLMDRRRDPSAPREVRRYDRRRQQPLRRPGPGLGLGLELGPGLGPGLGGPRPRLPPSGPPGGRPPLALLLGVFELIGKISELVGDFLGYKFADDIWPHMKFLFQRWEEESRNRNNLSRRSFLVGETSSSIRQVRGPLGSRNLDDPKTSIPQNNLVASMETKVQRAALVLLGRFAANRDCHQFLRPRVKEIAMACAGFLKKETEITSREMAVRLFCSLADINGDAIWLFIAQLCHFQISKPLCLLEGVAFQGEVKKYGTSVKTVMRRMLAKELKQCYFS